MPPSELDITWKKVIWPQFGAAIDMLENAIAACPDEIWNDRSRRPQFWYIAYHTLFWCDLYLFGAVEGFAPPAPFTLAELDPAGVFPEQPYTKDEIKTYLDHCRKKCRATLEALTDETARRRCKFDWIDVTFVELLLYNMRHVQHHVGQLNLILRQTTDAVPAWVARCEN